MRPGELGVVVLVALLAGFVRPVAAQSTIDGSTVRVFSVGTVGVERIALPDGNSVAVAQASAGHGTGFVVEPGLIMTAQHVVDGARHVVVRLPGDGGFFPARVVYASKAQDAAILAVEGALPPALAVNAAPPNVRSTVFAVGYPVDATRKQPQSARGIIAGYLDDGTVQLDMSLNPGNSGGPIVNEYDEVVGMAIARGAVEQGVQGIGYAVPVAILRAAIAEAKRRLASGEVRPGGMSRESATVVDGLVQHGAFYQLSKATDLSTLPTADLDQALAEVTARIQDADLLVLVASAMWNVSVVLEYVEPGKLKITANQAFTLRSRLRASAERAVRRAVQLDGTVGQRSAFVALALQTTDQVSAPSTTAVIEQSRTAPPSRPRVVVQGAPLIRHNASTGSVGWGAGASIAALFRRADRDVRPLFGVGVGTVRVSTSEGTFAHSLVAVQVGVLARFDRVELGGMVEGCFYASSVVSSTTSVSDASETALAMSVRASFGYRFGAFRLGTAARVLRGPTVWYEPVTLAVEF